MIGGPDSILVKIGSLIQSGKIIENRENPINIIKKSSAHDFEDIHLIFRVRGDMYSRM